MNKLLIITFAAFYIHACTQEKVILGKPAVDRRTELVSVVFRLAEKQEYASKQFLLYSDKIEKHFEKYKNIDFI